MLSISENNPKEIYYGNSIIHRIYLGSPNNLLCNSDREISKNSYLLAKYNLDNTLEIGLKYTLTIWGELGEGKWWAISCNSGLNGIGYNFKEISKGIYSGIIVWPAIANENTLSIYHAPANITSTSLIYEVKLEKNINTTPIWSPSYSEATINSNVVYKKHQPYNLLLNSDFKDGFNHWNALGFSSLSLTNNTITIDTDNTLDNRNSVKNILSNITTITYRGIKQYIALLNIKEKITASCWCMTDNISSFIDDVSDFYIEIYFCDENKNRIKGEKLANWNFKRKLEKNNTWVHCRCVCLAPVTTDVKYAEIIFMIVQNGRIWINGCKAEYGDNPYPEWTPNILEIS